MMNELREQSKKARMIVEQAGFGDVLDLDFLPSSVPPAAHIFIRELMWSVLDNELRTQCRKVASEASAVLASYGWQVFLEDELAKEV